VTDATPDEIAERLVRLFERSAVPHAIGGALAFGFWASPRGTHDVDMNVFAGAERLEAVLDALLDDGFTVDRAQAVEAVAEGGYVKAWFDSIPVDLFFNSIPLHDSAAKRVVRVPFGAGTAPILSAEDLVLLKLLFFRPKDLVDIPRVVATQREKLDRAYVRGWLVDMVGEDDPRTAKWDEFCRGLPPA
jgi:hypothetical protein